MPGWESLLAFIVRADYRSSLKWFLLATAIGIVAGLGAITFQYLNQTVTRYTLEMFAGYEAKEPAGEHRFFPREPAGSRHLNPWLLIAIMAGGGLLSGTLVYTFAPEAEGHGTDAAIDSFHKQRGFIRARIPIIKLIASALTIGTGGSGGREGPIAQIGAGFGSFLGTNLKLSARDRRIMLAAGMGAGVGSIFRAPLAGALFAGEILYSDADIESDVIVPAAIASIVGYSVFSLFLPAEIQFTPLFGNQQYQAMGSIVELFPLSLLAVVMVTAGAAYVKMFYGTTHLFKRLPIVPHLRPMIGATLAGACGLGLMTLMQGDERTLAVLGTGYGGLQLALDSSANAGTMLLSIALIKILTTSLTIGSGGSGGVFGPSMVIGGCLGAAVGNLLHQLSPTLVPQPQIYAIVGMAGFFSGIAHSPISTIIMVSEMTGDYKLLLPTMWVSTICFLLGRQWKLYEKQVPSRLDSPAHRGDFLVDLLEGIQVSEVPLTPRQTVPESAPLQQILQLITTSRQHYFPVVDREGRLVGIFSSDDVRAYTYHDNVWKLAVARDIMTTALVTLHPGEDLNSAMRRFTQLNLDEIPVVDQQDSGQLLGMLRRKEVIGVYNRILAEHKCNVQE